MAFLTLMAGLSCDQCRTFFPVARGFDIDREIATPQKDMREFLNDLDSVVYQNQHLCERCRSKTRRKDIVEILAVEYARHVHKEKIIWEKIDPHTNLFHVVDDQKIWQFLEQYYQSGNRISEFGGNINQGGAQNER